MCLHVYNYTHVLGAGRWLVQLWQVAWTTVYITSYSDFFDQTSPHTHVKLLKDPVVYCLWIIRFQSLEFTYLELDHMFFPSKCHLKLDITQKNFFYAEKVCDSMWVPVCVFWESYHWICTVWYWEVGLAECGIFLIFFTDGRCLLCATLKKTKTL